MNGDMPQHSLLELAQVVWGRRKWLAILVFAAAFSAVASVIAFMPDLYRATATVLVDRDQVPEALMKLTVTGEVETRLRAINEQILSRARLQEIINLFNLYPRARKKSPAEELIQQMRRDIRLELKSVEQGYGPRPTVAFALSYQGREPGTVALVANTLASSFIEENWKARGRQATETAEFFKTQLEAMRKRLDEQERKVGEFRRRYPGEYPQHTQAHLVALERLNMQLRLNMDRLTRVIERREALARQLAEALPYGSPDGRAGPPSAKSGRIAKLKQELMELRTRYSDSYPDVIRVKAEIAALERETGEAKAGGDPTVQQLKRSLSEVEAEIGAIKAEEKRLQQAIIAYERRIEGATAAAPEFSDMLSEYETTKDLYSSLLKRYADAQHAENWETRQKGEKFRILDQALPPTHPVAPNRPRLLLMGLALAIGAAAAAVMLAEQMDSTFHSVDDLRAFAKVPVLASIPRIVTEEDTSKREQRLRAAAAAAMIGIAVIVATSYFFARENESLVRLLSRGQASSKVH